jgi:FixJ family two-component response regulator
MAHQSSWPAADSRACDHAKLDTLAPREQEVLEVVARGLSTHEIVAALVVEETTITTHVGAGSMQQGAGPDSLVPAGSLSVGPSGRTRTAR